MRRHETLESPFDPRYLLEVVREAGFVDVRGLLEVDELVPRRTTSDSRSPSRSGSFSFGLTTRRAWWRSRRSSPIRRSDSRYRPTTRISRARLEPSRPVGHDLRARKGASWG
jgi:hypothetical protein